MPAVAVGSASAPEAPEAPEAAEAAAPAERFERLPVGSIVPGRYQPRAVIEPTELEALAASVRASGIIQPVLVRPIEGGRFELIAGERRWRAAQEVGLEVVPAVIRAVGDLEAAQWALVENVQRADLNPVEQARAVRRLVEGFGLTQAAVAERLGLVRPTVANMIRLLELDGPTLEAIAAGRLSAGHGKALLAAPDPASRRELAEAAEAGGWSVRRVEREAARRRDAGRPGDQAGAGGAGEREAGAAAGHRSAAIDDLERRLGEYLGAEVRLTVSRDRSKGRIAVAFYGLDHFDGLMRRIGFAEQPGGDPA